MARTALSQGGDPPPLRELHSAPPSRLADHAALFSDASACRRAELGRTHWPLTLRDAAASGVRRRAVGSHPAKASATPTTRPRPENASQRFAKCGGSSPDAIRSGELQASLHVCGLATRSAPLRTRPLGHTRGPHCQGPWRLPGPDSHRLAEPQLVAQLRHNNLLVVMAPELLDALPERAARQGGAGGTKRRLGDALAKRR